METLLSPNEHVIDPSGVTVHLLAIVSELKVLTKKRGLVRFGDVMNHAQRELILDCERQLREIGQIRCIVLKARQIGMSTAIEAIIFALSMVFRDMRSLVLSHQRESAEALLGMTNRYWTTFIFHRYYTERYVSKTHIAWTNGSDIHIATANNKTTGRSKTIHALHASEVAFWDDPETMMTGLRSSMPTFGLTAIFFESTANGVGNFFHRAWNNAIKEEKNEFKTFFFPWHEHPEYTAAFLPAHAQGMPLEHLDEEEEWLRSQGLTDGQLQWRRWAILNLCQNDIDKFHQEFPFSPHEAFVSTGRNVFPIKKLLQHYDPKNGQRGRLIKVGNKIQFHRDITGPLTIFAYPSEDKDWGVYLIGADPTHTTAGDYACAQVINRRTLEQVAVYRKKIDCISFAEDLENLGYYYNTATLAPEKTGPGYATIGALQALNYPHVLQMTKIDSTRGFISGDTLGWGTNRQTKHLAIANLVKDIMDPLESAGEQTYGLLIHDEITLTELRDYITTEDGQGYTNSDGNPHDDCVMALAIAVTCHELEPPVPAYDPGDRIRSVLPKEFALAKGSPVFTNYDPMWPEDPKEEKAQEPSYDPWEDWEDDDVA